MAANTYTQKIKVTLDGANKAAKGADKVSKGMSGLAKSALAAGAAYFGARGIINGVRSAVDAFAVQERAEQSLQTALGKTSSKLLAQASALQQVTMFGDEATIQQMAFLGSIGMTEEQISKIIPVAMDLATATGMTLESAVRNTAKTFSGLAGELGELVPQLRDLTAEEMKAGKAVEVMADLFGGQATAATDTLEGKIAQFNNSLGDLGEQMGEMLLPVITNVISAFGSFIGTIGSFFGFESKTRQRAIQDETVEFHSLLNVLKNTNTHTEARRRAIIKLNKDFPEYMGNLDAEKLKMEDIALLQKQSSDLALARIILLSREEQIAKALEDQEMAGQRLIKAEQNLNAAKTKNHVTKLNQNSAELVSNGITLQQNQYAALVTSHYSKENVENKKKELKQAKINFEAAVDHLNKLQTIESDEIKRAKALIATNDEKIKTHKEEKDALEEKKKLLEESWNATIKLVDIQRTLIDQSPDFIDNIGMQNTGQQEQLTLTEELAHQHQFLQDTIVSGDEPRMRMIALGKVMAASFNVQKDKLNEFTKSNVNSAMAIGAAQMHVGQAAADAAGAFIIAKTQEAIASFIADAFKKFGILGGIIGAGASGVVGSLMSQGIKSVAAAEGMNEVVTEPTLILAGEEGAEYVNIEPTQNEGAGMGGGGQIVFQGNVLSKDFIEDEAIPMIKEAIRRGHSIA